jgi:hypothetical protein
MNVTTNERKVSLFPPPRLMPNGENPPVIEPPLRDMLPFQGDGHVEELEYFETSQYEHAMTPSLASRATETATRDQRVIKLLGKRHIAIGVSQRESREKGEEKRITLVAVYFDYESNTAIEATLDEKGASVLAVEHRRYQPAPVQSEIEQAIKLAKGHQKMANTEIDDLTANAILVPDEDPSSPRYNHRLFDVRFFCAEERLARHMAIVDLSTQEVLRVSSCRKDGGCGESGSMSEGRAV